MAEKSSVVKVSTHAKTEVMVSFEQVPDEDSLAEAAALPPYFMQSIKQRKEKGRSLLNLSDLDRLRNPAYFRCERENRGGMGHNRLDRFTPTMVTTPSAPCCFSNVNWRSRSETSLYCERL
ncbi:unnamed protein product [Gongylonema pulchrum]|uniref:Uncharacterized protein n=1 Tax=Gongylonema pulchrum TaxID=637853 RepID=A0A3P6Q9C9_9BILA|nr:unnamed protein product [Gongylonema pulchrum]